VKTNEDRKTEKKTTNYNDLKKVLAGESSHTPCLNTALGCAHHKK